MTYLSKVRVSWRTIDRHSCGVLLNSVRSRYGDWGTCAPPNLVGRMGEHASPWIGSTGRPTVTVACNDSEMYGFKLGGTRDRNLTNAATGHWFLECMRGRCFFFFFGRGRFLECQLNDNRSRVWTHTLVILELFLWMDCRWVYLPRMLLNLPLSLNEWIILATALENYVHLWLLNPN